MLRQFHNPIGFYRRKSNQRGSALVELAVSSIALFAALFGFMYLSLSLYSFHFVAAAAQAGTRFAMVRGYYCTGLSACPARASDVQAYVKGLAYPGIDQTLVNVTTTWPTASCTPSVTPCNLPGNLVKVTVTYQSSILIPFSSSQARTWSSTSVMTIAQ